MSDLIDLSMIQTARLWMRRLHGDSYSPIPALNAAMLEKHLDARITDCVVLRTTWRTRVYRLAIDDEHTWIAKQICVGTDKQLNREFDQLTHMGNLALPGLQIPGPIALVQPMRAYVMAMAQGRSLKALLWDPAASTDLVDASRLAGQGLAYLHLAWTRMVQPVPVSQLAADLGHMPGGYSGAEWDTVCRALERVSQIPVAIGQLYLDFKASNLFYQPGAITLIDPPEEHRLGILLWDFATFKRYLSWQLRLLRIIQPWRRLQHLLDRALAAFEEGYSQVYSRHGSDVMLSPLLTDLLHLQQIGQIMALQLGKVRLASRFQSPLRVNGHWLREAVGSGGSLPVLWLEKQRCLRRLKRASSFRPARARIPGSALAAAGAGTNSALGNGAQLEAGS